MDSNTKVNVQPCEATSTAADDSYREGEIPDELDLFQSLKAEIEEANKEAESISYLSDARKSKSTGSFHNESIPSLNLDDSLSFGIDDYDVVSNANELNMSFCENIGTKQVVDIKEDIGINQAKPFNVSTLSESWINSTIFPNPMCIALKYDKEKSPIESEAKVKASIPLDTYIRTPLSNPLLLSNKENMRPYNNKIHFQLSDVKEDHKFQKLTINNVDYLVLSILGKGGTGQVFNCMNPADRREWAIKKISINAYTMESVEETKIMKQLTDCSSIIQLYQHELIGNFLYLVMEKGFSNLSVVIKEYFQNCGRLPFYKIIYYWMEILYAVQQMQSKGVVHLDLKLSNFVQCSNGIKLIDFGNALIIGNNNYAIKHSQVGSPNYVCPEALVNIATDCDNLNNKISNVYKVSFKSDIWSLGCILYQLVYKHPPFYHITDLNKKLIAICDPQHKIKYPEKPEIPKYLIVAMQSCLVYDMNKRPSINDLIHYFTTYIGI